MASSPHVSPHQRLARSDPAEPPGLDLARLLIRDPEQTVLLRVAGLSMQGAGIYHGDLLVVDRVRQARAGSIVVARFGGQFTLKRLCQSLEPGPGQARRWLEAAHPDYPPIPLEPPGHSQNCAADCEEAGEEASEQVQLWGVAVHVIHPL